MDKLIELREVTAGYGNKIALRNVTLDLGTAGQISFESVGSEETQENLRKLVRVAKSLGQKYDAVVTNPPYMGAPGI